VQLVSHQPTTSARSSQMADGGQGQKMDAELGQVADADWEQMDDAGWSQMAQAVWHARPAQAVGSRNRWVQRVR
jgi:hypothetical protein